MPRLGLLHQSAKPAFERTAPVCGEKLPGEGRGQWLAAAPLPRVEQLVDVIHRSQRRPLLEVLEYLDVRDVGLAAQKARPKLQRLVEVHFPRTVGSQVARGSAVDEGRAIRVAVEIRDQRPVPV